MGTTSTGRISVMIEYQKENKEHGRVHVDRKQDNLLRRYILWARVWADRSLLQLPRCFGDSLWVRRVVLVALLGLSTMLVLLLLGGNKGGVARNPLGRRARTGGNSCVQSRLSGGGDPDSRFTVIVNTFKRPKNLRAAIRHYEKCPEVDAIRVVWSEQDQEPPIPGVDADASMFSECVEVRYDAHPTSSLSNRFAPLADLRTQAVFNVDDDVNVLCKDLAGAHKMWRQTPEVLVGFIPRIHIKDPATEGAYLYRRWWTVFLKGSFSIILTKACFMHRDYLEMYTTTVPQAVIQHIDKSRNCEDIAMQFVVSNVTDKPSVWVDGRYTDSGALDGISTTGIVQHRKTRDECITMFGHAFGRMPLVYGEHYVTRAGSWTSFISPPTWLEWFAFP